MKGKSVNFKEYICSFLIGKKYRFNCDCSIPLDITGVVKDVKVIRMEIIIYIERDSDGKIYKIAANHPNLTITEV